MKSLRTLITIAVLLTTLTLFAQTENRTLMTVNIPFSFTVDNHTLPAGEYYVRSITPERSIALVSREGKHTLVVNDLPNYSKQVSSDSRLVFHKYGSEYFLTQVWTKGDNVARNPFVSQRAMELARAGSRPEAQVILAYVAK